MGKRFDTPWQVLMAKVKKFFRLVLVGLVVGAIIIGIGYIGNKMYPTVKYQVVEKEVVLDNLTAKVDELKASLIKDIFDVERAGHIESDGLITWDPNPNRKSVQIASIGLCQFKVSTVQYYMTKLHQQTLTGKEAVLLALDEEKCKQLMNDVIFTEKDGWKNWLNSGIKVNAASRLAIIRELQS
jgi:hypothetical protein